ncbi:MAG: hypothetical protein SFW09_05415 [Hyphomicrobiaceae bacterium]|nr:hypothetical protein [Hyphomicrobiaceae bacterium]
MVDLDLIDAVRRLVPADGTPVTVDALEQYAGIVEALIERGELQRVELNDTVHVQRLRPVATVGAGNDNALDWGVERNLYQPFLNYLRLRWPTHAGITVGDLMLTETVGDSRSEFDRPFSIPDLIVLNGLKYRWLPARELEVHTFEIKTSVGGSERDVYQAYAHSSFSNFAWMGWHIDQVDSDRVENAIEVARKTGVGLITCHQPDDYQTYQMRTPPRRNTPSLAALNQLIDLRLSEDGKSQLEAWLSKGV